MRAGFARRPAAFLAALAACSVMCSGSAARAEDNAVAHDDDAHEELPWRYRRVNGWDGLGIGIAGALGIAFEFTPPLREGGPRGADVDEAVRDRLRPTSPDQRRTARTASDVLVLVNLTYPMFDALVVAWWWRESRDAGSSMAVVQAQAAALTSALQGAMKLSIGRQRPYARNCADDPALRPGDCGRDRYQSFFSGHAAQAFAAATAGCVHHQRLELYRPGHHEWWPCAANLGVATSVGVLRMVADRHYLTDTVAGALVGVGVGLSVPLGLHYRATQEPLATGWTISPWPGGILLSSRFE